jgi:hypothetical protein
MNLPPRAVRFLRSLRARFGVNAPRVAVRVHTPWYVRAATAFTVALVIVGASWATWHYGSEFSGFRKTEVERELRRLSELNTKQSAQLQDMSKRLAESESQRKIDSVSHGDLAKQVKALAAENASLKDDLAFFHSLLPPAGGDDTVALGRLKVEPDPVQGEHRFRMLLVRGGQRPADFVGQMQLVVNAVQGSEKISLSLPQEGAAPEYQLNFKSFQRVEGVFKTPPGAIVKSVQVRVFQKGLNAPKLVQSVNID